MKKQTINARIEGLIDLLDMNNNSFGLKANILPQSLGNVINGKSNNPTFDMLEKILITFPNISAEWLMRNKGEPIIDPAKELKVSLADYNKLNEQLERCKKECQVLVTEKAGLSKKLNGSQEMLAAQESMISSQAGIIDILRKSHKNVTNENQ